jgi:hypothetical protein
MGNNNKINKIIDNNLKISSLKISHFLWRGEYKTKILSKNQTMTININKYESIINKINFLYKSILKYNQYHSIKNLLISVNYCWDNARFFHFLNFYIIKIIVAIFPEFIFVKTNFFGFFIFYKEIFVSIFSCNKKLNKLKIYSKDYGSLSKSAALDIQIPTS